MAGSDPILVRARDAMGRFIPDDPSTPDINEAWTVVQDNDSTSGGGV